MSDLSTNPLPGYVRVTNRRVDMAPDSQPESDEVVVPVDRTNPVLGNPHILRNKLDPIERAAVIRRYEIDLDRDIATDGPMNQAIKALASRVVAGERICLQCNCRPLPCHADVIADRVNQRVATI